MALERGTPVQYNSSKGPTLALVQEHKGDNVYDLVVFDCEDGQSSARKDIPQRDKGQAAGHNWEPR